MPPPTPPPAATRAPAASGRRRPPPGAPRRPRARRRAERLRRGLRRAQARRFRRVGARLPGLPARLPGRRAGAECLVLARRELLRDAELPDRAAEPSTPCCSSFPDSAKAPDALLKKGYCLIELGQSGAGRSRRSTASSTNSRARKPRAWPTAGCARSASNRAEARRCAADAARRSRPDRLRLTEIFLSLQGEARSVGWPTVFVRLTGCPLRCQYCDTAYAFHGGEWWDIDAILAEVARHGVRHVCVTGGEPLAQKRCIALLERCATPATRSRWKPPARIDISGGRPARVARGRPEDAGLRRDASRNLLANIPLLTRARPGQVRALRPRRLRVGARRCCAEHALDARCEVLFSPSFGQVPPRELAEWILADRLPVRFQMQLHKQLWGDEQGPMTRDDVTGSSCRPRAVVLVSGGMDSAVVLALAREQRPRLPRACRCSYGQRHAAELAGRRRAGAAAGRGRAQDRGRRPAQHRRLGADRRHRRARVRPAPGIPVTYVPARNTIMLSVALGWAEVLGAREILCGVNAVDYSGYPDCRPEFIAAFERAGQPGDQGRRRGRGAARARAADAHVEGRHRARGPAPGRGFRAHRVLLPGRRAGPRLRRLRCLPAARGGLRRAAGRRSHAIRPRYRLECAPGARRKIAP